MAGNASQKHNFIFCLPLELQFISWLQSQCVTNPLGNRDPALAVDFGLDAHEIHIG